MEFCYNIEIYKYDIRQYVLRSTKTLCLMAFVDCFSSFVDFLVLANTVTNGQHAEWVQNSSRKFSNYANLFCCFTNELLRAIAVLCIAIALHCELQNK